MKFLIYGAGALGQTLGCLLAAAGHRVDLLLRERYVAKIEANGLRVNGIFGDFEAPLGNLGLLTRLDQAMEEYDYALITTKSYDTSQAVMDLAPMTNRLGAVVSMQNGCGNVEKVEAGFGGEKSLGARVITGFEITEPGRIEITVSADAIHVGGTIGGDVPESAERLAVLISEAGHPAVAVADIHKSLYAKLLYNCTLNPLGAILGVHYGALAEKEETRKVMDRVIDETFAVIEGLGGKTDWCNAAKYREFFYSKLIPATYNHRSSMLQDLENNKPTEVDSLIGWVSNKARILDIATPSCDLLAELVRFKEAEGLKAA